MKETNVLRLSFTAPSAHFRIIHSKNPRRTYPLPPYSTVIGILANIIGCQGKIQEMLQKQFALGTLCTYDYITREYTWLRNISSKAHKKRFVSPDVRDWQGMVDHPGGQSPVVVEVLNDIVLKVYISHADEELLNTLQINMFNPEKWLSHLHLGRSEDWIIPVEAQMMELKVSNKPYDLSQAEGFYQWMPEPNYCLTEEKIIDDYKQLYMKTQGSVFLVTSIYNLVEMPEFSDNGKADIIRNFSHIPARIASNPVPFLEDLNLPHLLSDQELHVPVYMTRISGGGMIDE